MKAMLALCIVVLLLSPTSRGTEIPLAQPGNIQASFLRDSVNHILGFVVPVLGYYLWGGGIEGNIPIGVSLKGALYTLNVNSIHFNPIDPFTTAELNWVEDDARPAMEFFINNITCDLDIDIKLWLAHIIPLWGGHFSSQDLNVTMKIGVDEAFDVFPQFFIEPHFEATDLTYSVFYLGTVIRFFIKPD